MKLRLFSAEGKVAEIEVDPSQDTLETICVLAEIELGIPLASQRLSWGTVPLPSGNMNTPLSQFSFREHDPIQVTSAAATSHQQSPPPPPQQQQQQPAHQPPIPAAAPSGGGAGSGDAELLRLFGNTAPQQQQPRSAAPPAGTGPAAAAGGAGGGQDNELLRLFGGGGGAAGIQQQQHRRQLLQQQQLLPNVNMDDPEYQKKLYEEIQRKANQEAVQENLMSALEMTPEAFASVHMLYVPARVNGHEVAAFVDSGAQMTIISEKMAEKMNLTRIIDRRHRGTAQGVGTCEIVGAIHLVPVTIAGIAVPMKLTVIAQDNMDFLLGLDQLKHHRMCIDLAANCLRVGGDGDHSAPFLSEGELVERGILKRSSVDRDDAGGGSQQQQGMGPRESSSDAARSAAAAAAAGNRQQTEQARAQLQRQQQQGGGGGGATTSDAAPNNSAPAAGGSSSSSSTTAPAGGAAGGMNLNEEQRAKVQSLCSLFGCAPADALQVLVAADWNPDVAASLLMG